MTTTTTTTNDPFAGFTWEEYDTSPETSERTLTRPSLSTPGASEVAPMSGTPPVVEAPETSRVEPSHLAPVKVGHSSEAGMPDIRVPSDVVVVPSEDEDQAAHVPSDWQWDPAKGLQSAKAWMIALAACKCIRSWKAKVLGAVIREHVHVRDGTVYVGIQRLAEDLGWFRRDIETCRNVLREAGWLVDTGERKSRAIVFRLHVPRCACQAGTVLRSGTVPV